MRMADSLSKISFRHDRPTASRVQTRTESCKRAETFLKSGASQSSVVISEVDRPMNRLGVRPLT